MEYRFKVVQDWNFSDTQELYLWGYADGKSYNFKIKGDFLEATLKEEGEAGDPFLILPKMFSNNFLQSFVEGLREAGFVAEVDNKQRIVAEALSAERKEERDIMRDKLFEIMDRVII